MRIEKINENKIRIFLGLDDLKEKKIDIHSFMANPIESQSLFLDVLKIAEKDFGFSTKDYKVSIEAIAMSYGDFILTVTRDKDTASKKKRHFEVKRKMDNTKQTYSVFAFDNFDDFIEFCNCFKTSHISSFKKYLRSASLYELSSTYYFVFETPDIDVKSIYGFLSEFSSFIFDSDLYVRKLKEYGNLIIKSNAISVINKNFV